MAANNLEDSNIFHLSDPSEAKSKSNLISKQVEECGYALIRGFFNRDDVRNKLPIIKDSLSKLKPLPSSGVSPESIKKNTVKWSIGSQSGSQSGISRLMITIMNPMYEEDFLGLRDSFKKLVILRDALAKREQTLFDEALPKPKFNGTRLQIYPSGGAFMTSHIDERAIENVSDISDSYIQLVLLMTEKGLDYKKGGAFVEKNGNIIDSESGSLSGDVLVYSGNTKHGVADIDSNLVFDPPNHLGRVVALATIYN